MNGHGTSFAASCAIHAALLFGTTGMMMQSARYDVEAGIGGTEVSLIAAPWPVAETAQVPAAPLVLNEEPAQEAGADDWALDPVPVPVASAGTPPNAPTPSALEQPNALRQSSPYVGDGSSPVVGQDATTLLRVGGALSGQGGRLKNPAPPYPYAAIRQGQEGVVILAVSIDKAGRPLRVDVTQSSGFLLLDQSALRTVRRWTFDPAHIGFLPVQSSILVPIRFVLDERLKGVH